MSHVATVNIEIKSLDDLAAACASLGLEFVRDQTTYEWFGESVGDTPLPDGFQVEDLGRCQHAIRVPLVKQEEYYARHLERPYEIGVCARRDGKPGWVLLWDYYDNAKGLQDFVGPEGNQLKQAYARQAAKRTMIAQGYRAQETKLPNGSIQLQFVR